jgi:hypothetical protein
VAFVAHAAMGQWRGDLVVYIVAVLFVAMHAAFYEASRRLLGTSRAVSYLVSFLFTYNARTLDAFRYGPALDATVYGQIAMLLVVMHHIISYAWSLAVFSRELGAFYAAFLEGRELCLPELPVQYADFAIWQRGWLQGEKLEKQLSYWRKQLAGAPPLLELPTDFPRPAAPRRATRSFGASFCAGGSPRTACPLGVRWNTWRPPHFRSGFSARFGSAKKRR